MSPMLRRRVNQSCSYGNGLVLSRASNRTGDVLQGMYLAPSSSTLLP